MENQTVTEKKEKGLIFVLLPFILITAVISGVAGYYLGKQTAAQSTSRISQTIPTPTPTPTANPTKDTGLKPLEPVLVSTSAWQNLSFPQDIKLDQGNKSQSAKITLRVPQDWIGKTVQTRAGEGIGDSVCNDFVITSANKKTQLTLKPDCGDIDNTRLPISGQLQKVQLTPNKGNDRHDSYIIRYLDGSKNLYRYGTIGVAPGQDINTQTDKIYSYLVLQYEPDRYEEWLWVSCELLYTGDTVGLQEALVTADTVVSTLLLAD